MLTPASEVSKCYSLIDTHLNEEHVFEKSMKSMIYTIAAHQNQCRVKTWSNIFGIATTEFLNRMIVAFHRCRLHSTEKETIREYISCLKQFIMAESGKKC